MDDKFQTPMMQQYMEIKNKYKDTLLLFRLGDFYEMFMDDAHTGAKVLGITLTSRKNQKDGDIPMAGIPYHALENYLYKLVSANLKVAICEQVSDPKQPGIVKREVVRVVTPGTILSDKGLDTITNNYIASVKLDLNTFAFVVADFSTSEIYIHQGTISNNTIQQIKNLIYKFNPQEILVDEETYNSSTLLGSLISSAKSNIFTNYDWPKGSTSEQFLIKKLNVTNLKSFNLDKLHTAQNTLHSLIEYIEKQIKTEFKFKRGIKQIISKDRANINALTINNLEIFNFNKADTTKVCLFNTINRTSTPMGARLLKKELVAPLTSIAQIEQRLNTTEYFFTRYSDLSNLKQILKHISDIERITTRLIYEMVSPRDLNALKNSLKNIFIVKEMIEINTPPELIKTALEKLDNTLFKVIELIESYIVEEPPITIRDGKIIKQGVNTKLDETKNSIATSAKYLENLENLEKERTQINSLKVRFNKVFGYYIEVPKARSNEVPSEYERKQTLVNAERYITPELKEHESLVLNAQETINHIEYEIFTDIVKQLATYTTTLLTASETISIIDMFVSFGEQAVIANYVRPQLNNNRIIELTRSRHPSLENISGITFIPNNVFLSKGNKKQIAIITGPNMSGKSTYIRQTALNVLMAQCGMFIACKQANICPVDGIYTRIGASDNLSEGLSTFMLEMVETASILNDATDNSLIIFDEVGRGTSTYDGISIAYSIIEYLATTLGAYTLFATHYHELTSLSSKFDNVFNLQVKVEETESNVIFMHEVIEGSASKSYGIHVAEKAGIDESIISSAYKVLLQLESKQQEITNTQTSFNLGTTPKKSEVEEMLKKIDINKVTPIESLNILNALIEKLDE